MERQELIQALDNLSGNELEGLITALEDKWEIKRPNFGGVPQDLPKVEDEPAEEQTEFDVVLESFPASKKVAVIKLVREQIGLALKEAKEFAESVPKVLKEAATKEEAEEVKAKFAETEAVIVLK